MRAKTHQKLIFAVLSLSYLLPFVQGVVTTVTARDIMAGLELNHQGMGLLGACFLFPYATSMFSSGMISAMLGPRKTLAGMFLVAGAGGLVFSSADSLALACAGRAMTGFGTAVCLTASFTLFARWFKAESYAAVTGIFFAVGGSGALFGAAPLAVASGAYGWRWCYAGIAFMTLFCAALVFLVGRDWPAAGGEKELGVSAAPRDPVTPKAMLEGLGILSKDRDFWRMCIWFMALSSIYQPFVNLWAAPYFRDVFRMNEAWGGLCVSMFSFGFIAGNPLISWLCEKHLHSNRVVMGAAGLMTAAGFAPLFFLREHMNGVWIPGICLFLGFALNGPNTALYSSARNIFGSRLSGVASGLMAGMSQVSGAVTQLVVSGLLSFATNREWGAPDAYLFAFCGFFPACAVMAYCGFTLTRASAPGHVSPRSWRALLRKGEEEARK